jgi:hypothetical protein
LPQCVSYRHHSPSLHVIVRRNAGSTGDLSPLLPPDGMPLQEPHLPCPSCHHVSIRTAAYAGKEVVEGQWLNGGLCGWRRPAKVEDPIINKETEIWILARVTLIYVYIWRSNTNSDFFFQDSVNYDPLGHEETCAKAWNFHL